MSLGFAAGAAVAVAVAAGPARLEEEVEETPGFRVGTSAAPREIAELAALVAVGVAMGAALAGGAAGSETSAICGDGDGNAIDGPTGAGSRAGASGVPRFSARAAITTAATSNAAPPATSVERPRPARVSLSVIAAPIVGVAAFDSAAGAWGIVDASPAFSSILAMRSADCRAPFGPSSARAAAKSPTF
jgi:hypothetical protein